MNSSGSLVKVSGGLLTLSGNNGYTGATSVDAGTLTLSGTLASTSLTVGTLGTLNAAIGSLFPTTSVLTADGLVNLDNSAVEILTLLGGGTVNLNTTALTLGAGTFSGALNSTGSLVKVSGGLLTLSGNNGYTGATSVEAGTLTLSGTLAITTLTVGTLGTLNAASGSLFPTTSALTSSGGGRVGKGWGARGSL